MFLFFLATPLFFSIKGLLPLHPSHPPIAPWLAAAFFWLSLGHLSTAEPMALLNPSGASLTTLTFTALATAGSTTDDLGNPRPGSRVVTVAAVVTPLALARIADLTAAVGVHSGAIPVKVRVQAWPNEVRAQQPAVASLTYNGRAASIHLATIREQNPHAAALTPEIGQSCEGLLVYG